MTKVFFPLFLLFALSGCAITEAKIQLQDGRWGTVSSFRFLCTSDVKVTDASFQLQYGSQSEVDKLEHLLKTLAQLSAVARAAGPMVGVPIP